MRKEPLEHVAVNRPREDSEVSQLSFCPLRVFVSFIQFVLFITPAILLMSNRAKAVSAEEHSDDVLLAKDNIGQGYPGESNQEMLDFKVEICDWYGGAAGAASISIDDSFDSCRDVLNRNGFKGTYYLSGTDKFSETDWDLWREIHAEGHEIGCHTVSHRSCHILDEVILRWEFSNNIKDIVTNLGLQEEDILSFAWPRGDASASSKVIASEYFICARGYHINQLEEKDPIDFMYLKCLNTPHYHYPSDDPPDYFQKADEAERLGKWVHFVFHNECPDEGAISYLATKNLWVAPVGTVAKYIKERQNSCISDVVHTDAQIRFILTSPHLARMFDQELTIKVFLMPTTAQAVLVNGNSTVFTNCIDHIMFNIRPSGTDKIKIVHARLSQDNSSDLLSASEKDRQTIMKVRERLAKGDGVVTNIWISERARLDNLRINNIKYLFVDIGDTSPDGQFTTPIEEIVRFVHLVKSYEKQHGYDFVILPYSEINTQVYHLDRQFKENFIADYRKLMSIGFEGVYVDIEPVKKEQKEYYIEFLKDVSVICPKGTILGVYSGSLSDSEWNEAKDNEWQWSLSFFRRVAEVVDLICVPGYDFDLHSKKAYQASIQKQVGSLSEAGLPCQLMLSVPTHKREPETLINALAAYNSEITKHTRHQFIGVCVFAEWTTIPEEWNAFKSEK